MNNITAVGAYMSSIQQSYAKIQTAIADLRLRIDTVEKSLQQSHDQISSTEASSPKNTNLDEVKNLLQSQQQMLDLLQQRIQQLEGAIDVRVDAYLKSSSDIDEKIKAAINIVLEGLAAATSADATSSMDPPPMVTEPTPVKKITRKKAT